MKISDLKISTKLLIAFLLIGLAPASAVGVLALQKAESSLKHDAENNLAGISEYKTQMIEDFIHSRMADVHTVPLTPTYIKAAKAFAKGTAEEKSEAKAALLHNWEINKKLHGYFNEVKLLDLQGNHLASLAGITENESQKSWFKKALENAKHTHKGEKCNDLYVSPIEYCAELKRASIHMAHVIRDRETFEPLAMYVVDVNTDVIQDLMSQTTGLGKTGQTYIVGADFKASSNLRSSTTPAIFKTTIKTKGSQTIFADRNEKRGPGICQSLSYIGASGNKVLAHNHYIKPIDGAVMTEIDQAEAFEAVSDMQTMMLIVAAIGISATIIAALLIARSLCRPITGMTGAMHTLANGNLEENIPHQGRGDEIGAMANAVQVFKDNAIRVKRLEAEQEEQKHRAEQERHAAMHALADTFEQSVGQVINTVTSAATELQAASAQMATTAQETSAKSTAVASASEEASTNVQTVAASAEELTASITEIGQQVQRSTEVSEHAVTAAEETSHAIENLSNSVSQIGEVVSLINDIADQTNLLALNATIEAARAGDAGKGFAVVASEVKNLANQTSRATGEISGQINQVQTGTADAVQAIAGISVVIKDMRDISSSIAAAVEEQGAATSEIARNVEQASAGTAEVSENIVIVEQAANETGAAASQIETSSTDLSRQAEILREEVNRFLAQVRSDNANVELMKWDKKIESGVQQIDNDHRQLIAIVNAAYKNMQTGKGGEAANLIANELTQMLEQHCRDEESLMAKISYPGLQDHKHTHEVLLAEFVSLKEQLDKGQSDAGPRIFNFLVSWLQDHTYKHDLAFVKYAKKQGKEKLLMAS